MGVSQKKNLVYPNELVLIYSGYWRHWSRVLYMEADSHLCVEVNLTPPNPTVEWEWKDRIKPVILRQHRTGRDQWKDKLFRFVVDKSPVYQRLYAEISKHVGAPIAGRLMHEDFLPQIDWPEYQKHCNGGCPFDKCRKGVRG